MPDLTLKDASRIFANHARKELSNLSTLAGDVALMGGRMADRIQMAGQTDDADRAARQSEAIDAALRKLARLTKEMGDILQKLVAADNREVVEDEIDEEEEHLLRKKLDQQWDEIRCLEQESRRMAALGY